MRIVGGRHRGRALVAPPGRDIRPTSDRAREALFNILTHGEHAELLRDATVLDAFAGTGAFGLEALSRGAAEAYFIENARPALDALRRNIDALGETARASVRSGDATRPPPAPKAATLAFLDPPYRSGLGPAAVEALAAAGWLAGDALVILEISAKEEVATPERFDVADERRYGAARLVFLKRQVRA
jgi:16S rRNA (guanine966-N2)-methyltransferase